MLKIKNDRVALLEALKELVEENIDVISKSDDVPTLKEKRHLRDLKVMLKELDDFIDETSSYQKLREQEREYNNVKRQKMVEYYANRNND